MYKQMLHATDKPSGDADMKQCTVQHVCAGETKKQRQQAGSENTFFCLL